MQKTKTEVQNHRRVYTHAQIKLVLIFCAYGLNGLINYSAYSRVLRKEGAYSQALEQYLSCEEMGSSNNTCDRSIFEEHDPTPVTFPLTTISHVLVPLAILIYVANTKRLLKYFQTKIKSKAELKKRVYIDYE